MIGASAAVQSPASDHDRDQLGGPLPGSLLITSTDADANAKDLRSERVLGRQASREHPGCTGIGYGGDRDHSSDHSDVGDSSDASAAGEIQTDVSLGTGVHPR